MGLRLDELNSDTMMYAMTLIQKYSKTSRNDCFALALARQENCPLLTGDKALKEAAENEATIVKGTLWLVEQMIKHQFITIRQASVAYQKMQSCGRRLPWKVAEVRLDELEKHT